MKVRHRLCSLVLKFIKMYPSTVNIIVDCVSASSSAYLPRDTEILDHVIDDGSSGELDFHCQPSCLDFTLLRSKNVTIFPINIS